MADPMTDERFSEISRHYGGLSDDAYSRNHAVTHAMELVAEVKRLTGELDRANGSISAIRGWAVSRLEILHHPQHVPHSSVHAAQVAVLDDLIRSLDHLVSRPQQ